MFQLFLLGLQICKFSQRKLVAGFLKSFFENQEMLVAIFNSMFGAESWEIKSSHTKMLLKATDLERFGHSAKTNLD